MNNILWFVAIIIVWLSATAKAFTCKQKGIFANTDTNDCKSFVICDSSLQPKVTNCFANAFFWPEKKGCYSQYNCAASTMPGNVDPCAGFKYNNIPDKNSTDCTNYISCGNSYSISDGNYIEVPQVMLQTCPFGQAFRPDFGCTDNYKCVNYECTEEGIFENPSDCSTFIQCWKYSINGVPLLFPDLNYCPANTKFNPILQKCDEFYNCDGVDPYDGVDPCLNYNYANPYVPNPFDSTASSYLECQYSSSSTGSTSNKEYIMKKDCPADTLFSPLLGKCYNNYDPTEWCSKDPCSSGPGKYVHYKSDHCDSFIECRDETTTSEVYEPTYEIRYCPDGTRYSPETRKCSKQYVCPKFPVDYCYPQIPTTTTTTTTTTTSAAPAAG